MAEDQLFARFGKTCEPGEILFREGEQGEEDTDREPQLHPRLACAIAATSSSTSSGAVAQLVIQRASPVVSFQM